jgi:hypothetical protein
MGLFREGLPPTAPFLCNYEWRIGMSESAGKRVLFAVVFFAMIVVLSFTKVESIPAAGTDTFQFNVSASMEDNLSMLRGKTVTVYLATGQTIIGTVNDVKGNLLHLTKLSQKEFFDALIAIDRISAIDTRVKSQ